MKYRANVYYCGHLKKGRFVYITEEEMARGVVTFTNRFEKGQKTQIIWIFRPIISSYEQNHGFGISIPNSEVKRYLQNHAR